jgi:hypothetical protein
MVAFFIATAFSATVFSRLGWGEKGPAQKWKIATSSAIAPTPIPMKPITDLLSSIDPPGEFDRPRNSVFLDWDIKIPPISVHSGIMQRNLDQEL